MVTTEKKNMLDELLSVLKVECSDYERLEQALTHSSYTYENRISKLENNERLEFLGDAVLKLISSEYLTERFPEYEEGDLTKIRAILVSDKVLSKFANRVNLGKYLRLGVNEERNGGRKRESTLACAFEALLGALYLENKFFDLKFMLIEFIEDEVTIIDENASKFNYKAILQEWTQSVSNELPEYITVKEEGPSHNKTFYVDVKVDGAVKGKGVAQSKKEAQKRAAKDALLNMNLLKEEEVEEQDEE